MEALKLHEELYYRDFNSRVYESDGFKSVSPIYAKYFRKIEFDENGKAKYGTLNRKNKEFRVGSNRWQVFTKSEMEDDIYINDNVHLICEAVRSCKNVETLKKIAKILENK